MKPNLHLLAPALLLVGLAGVGCTATTALVGISPDDAAQPDFGRKPVIESPTGSNSDPKPPKVLSKWKSWRGVRGGRRAGAHAGMDFAGKRGDPVVASADGVVSYLTYGNSGCGTGVILRHDYAESEFYFTVYCHMKKGSISVAYNQELPRGFRIGDVGDTGDSSGNPHVHFEVNRDGIDHRDGNTKWTRNPKKFLVGCFDSAHTYPSDRFVATYPLLCRDR